MLSDAPETCSKRERRTDMCGLQACDLWSIGCILSEALVWSFFGMGALSGYRSAREEENQEKLGYRSNAFHDETNVLDAVSNAHSEIREQMRTQANEGLVEVITCLLDFAEKLLRPEPMDRCLDEKNLKSLQQCLRVTISAISRSKHQLQAYPTLELENMPWRETRETSFQLQSLVREMADVAHTSISMSNRDGPSLMNFIKGLLEDMSGEPWIWWPLGPRLPKLGPNQTRMSWICVRYPKPYLICQN
jgi:serine/threonine protein kinase